MTSERPRLSIDITPKQQRFLKRLPFGWRQQIFSALIDMLMDMVERCGISSLGAISSRAIKLDEYFNEED
jgi:hypothetical protein